MNVVLLASFGLGYGGWIEFGCQFFVKMKNPLKIRGLILSAGPGLEPGPTDPETAVLPLNYPALCYKYSNMPF